MAPGGPRREADTPYIKRVIREMLKEELSLERWDGSDGSAIIQLKLDGKPIGAAMRININWKQDHGHGGGSYVNGINLVEV